MNTDMTYWKFLQQPENAARHRRFGFAMQGMKSIEPADMILKGTVCDHGLRFISLMDNLPAFNWESLRENSLIVDVGGGIGVTSMPLARKYPNLNIIIQDLAPVVEDAKKVSLIIKLSRPSI